MEHQQPFVITVVGAESSGKTTLARHLAEIYGCPWVPEYARTYLSELQRPYTEADLARIAEGQLTAILNEIDIIRMKSHLHEPLKGEQIEDVHIPVTLHSKRQHRISGFGLDGLEKESRALLVVDGGMLTLRMWARIKYGSTIPLVEEALEEDVTSLYILCRPVLPWVQDPLREAPLLLDRVWIYNQYLQEIVKSGKRFQIVSAGSEGTGFAL